MEQYQPIKVSVSSKRHCNMHLSKFQHNRTLNNIFFLILFKNTCSASFFNITSHPVTCKTCWELEMAIMAIKPIHVISTA